ncbi:helix-turn-helix transcriptional regulator [Adlercreutzia aquisgranensis]|uniref:helix-turn-helix transcriptional regulator n=1 Tax=Adlercreutzia aquisgranensis TaxID=2941323 RepID=UPI00203DD21F|nr:LuxR C-terminal-related transcriptional regulator [Adlercreutzia aquisgranensis]
MGDAVGKTFAPLDSIGVGLIYAWMWATFWSSLVLGEGAFTAEQALAIFLVWRVGKLLAFFGFSMLRRPFIAFGPVALGFAGATGTVVIAVGSRLLAGSALGMAAAFAGAAVFAVIEAVFFVSWNAAFARLEYDLMLKNAATFIGFGAAVFLVLTLIGYAVSVAIVCVLPVLSGLLLKRSAAVSPQADAKASRKGEAERGDGEKRTMLGCRAEREEATPRGREVGPRSRGSKFLLPWSLVASVVLIAVANGYIRGSGASVVGDGAAGHGLLLFVSIVAASYVVFAVNSLKMIYVGSFLLVSAGLLMQSLPLPLGTPFIGLGFVCFEVAMWVLIAAMAKKHGVRPFVACGRVWFCLETGLMAGTLLGMLVSVLPFGFQADLFVRALSLVLAYGILLLLSVVSTKPFLSIIKDEALMKRAEGEYHEKVEATAVHFGLTPRETEVLRLIAYGRDVRFIEEALVLSTNTVKTHFRHIYAKCGVTGKQELLDKIAEQEALRERDVRAPKRKGLLRG